MSSSAGVVKREPSPERRFFSPEPAGPPARREHRPPHAYPPPIEPAPYIRSQAPAWRVHPPSAAPPSTTSGQRSWLNTVQNDPEAEPYAASTPSSGGMSSVFPSYGAPNTPMRPNQRHAPGYTCPDCETTHTAAWRWYEGRKYCNACGLHRKANGKKRSERLIEQDKQRREDKARAEREFLSRIDNSGGGGGGLVKREDPSH